MSLWLFYVVAALTLVFAVTVVSARNPVRGAMSLVAMLLFIAVLYVALEAHLVAALQIIVYAGAVMVLFLFVIMLLNVHGDPEERPRAVPTLAAAASATLLAAVAGRVLWGSLPAGGTGHIDAAFGTTRGLARVLFNEHMVAFELTSLFLLTAIVGAVVLAHRESKDG